MALPRWGVFGLVAAVPIASYSWILYTRPNVYEQLVEEIKRQEEAEKIKGKPAALR